MLQNIGPWQYREEDRLGGGGLAQTYRCSCPNLPGSFAIKVLRNPEHVNTLLREVRALIKLDNCKGVPTLLDYGRNEKGQLCMVSTLMPGVRLDHYIRRQGPLSTHDTLTIVGQLLVILRHAHAKGLLHKDIKHSNILLVRGQVSLIDWGASEFSDELPSETLRAKLSYTAPEAYFGRHGPASDLYALGWLAVYLATGLEPFHCAEIKDKHYWALAHLLEAPHWPDSLPREVARLAQHWLHRDPAHRSVAYDLSELHDTQAQAIEDEHRLEFEAIAGKDYLLLGAQCGAPYLQCELARRLEESHQNQAAMLWLEAAARQRYPKAQRMLAVALADSAENVDRKRLLLEDAAKAGSAPACYYLAKILLHQDAARPKSPTVRGLLVRAASMGHIGAMELLARYLSEPASRLALEQAAEGGHPRALKVLHKKGWSNHLPIQPQTLET